MLRTLSVTIVLAAALSACSKNEAPPAPTAAAPHPPAARSMTPPTGARNAGKVLQVQQGGGYTFVEIVADSGQKAWVAGTQIDIKPGDVLEWGTYDVMRNFTSRSLGRTFEQILFVNQWGKAGGAVVATTPHGNFGAAPPALVAPGAAGGADSGVVKSVANAGGYSYIEVERGGSTVWVAATEVALKAGDKIQWQGGSEMRNFTAKSLNRTFERITFASSVSVQR